VSRANRVAQQDAYPASTSTLVILTNGKDLLLAHAGDCAGTGKKQILRYAQDDKVWVI
jgi:hypothetical protein